MASGDGIDSIELEQVAQAAGTVSSIEKSNINEADIIASSDKIISIPSTSNQYNVAAAIAGGDDSTRFIQSEKAAIAANQLPKLSSSSTLDTAAIGRTPSTAGKHSEKKIGHRRVDEGGEVTYKKIQSKQIMGSIQLGIQHTVGSLASKPKRDLLMNDFWEVETIAFPPDGSSITPAHHYSDFTFKVYAPIAFRYFRDLFGIAPDDFLMSMCAAPLRQLSNPGASGSIFYLTDDDEFIVKTVQRKEGEFLQKLLPGYYMNLSQNPRTLLPKFFGLYCFHYNSKNVRLVAMNNLLPSEVKMHAKYDLKGSTFRRKASKAERQKSVPTYKDLDFMEHFPNGIFLETDKYNALMKTIQRDCMVLESFQIMDYSLLVGIHNLDTALKERREERIRNARLKLQRNEDAIPHVEDTATEADQGIASAGATALNRTRSMNRQRLVINSTPMESIQADNEPFDEEEDVPAGGIPARSENDERLLLYIGIIDILQSYRLEKKLEHTFKSIIYNGDTVSVCRPSFYAQRFQNFMGKTVFKKTPTFPLKHSPPKRKPSTANMNSSRLQSLRTPGPQSSSSVLERNRPPFISGSSTPPPAFDDISSDDVTVGNGAGGSRFRRSIARSNASTSISSTTAMAFRQISYVSSDCSDTEDEIRRTSVQIDSVTKVDDLTDSGVHSHKKEAKEIIVLEKAGTIEPLRENQESDSALSADESSLINSTIKKTMYLSTLVVGDVSTS